MFFREADVASRPPDCLNIRYGQAVSSFGLLARSAVSRSSELRVIVHGSQVVDRLGSRVVCLVEQPSTVGHLQPRVPGFAPAALSPLDASLPGVFVGDAEEETELGLTATEWEALGEEIGRAKADADASPRQLGVELEAAPTPQAVSLSQLSFSGNPMRRDRDRRLV